MASRRIEDMVPELQIIYAAFKAKMDAAGIGYIVTSTRRTQEDQDALYAKGRTEPGRIVTWTRKSRHIGGKAFDIAVLIGGRVTWDPLFYQTPGEIGMSVGLKWGGTFKTPDLPHFELMEE